jgi:hypothetical protein
MVFYCFLFSATFQVATLQTQIRPNLSAQQTSLVSCNAIVRLSNAYGSCGLRRRFCEPTWSNTVMRNLLFVPIFAALSIAPVYAQNTEPQTPAPEQTGGLNGVLAQAERNQDADSLLLAYGQAVTNPDLARLAIGQLLTNFYTLRNQAQTPEQVTQAVGEASLRFQVLQAAQNQVLIQQNQQILQQNAQIIALLQRGQIQQTQPQIAPNR